MITLYHGTNVEAGLSIIKDKAIKHKIKRRFDSSSGHPTTDGYVYLTDSLGLATYHGNAHNRMKLNKKENCIFIFRITLDEKKLSADIDEYLFQEDISINESNIHEYDFKRSLDELATCRINETLTSKNSTIEYVFIDDNLVNTIGDKAWSNFIANSLSIDETKHQYDELVLNHLDFKPL